jgi:hypothetical protein
MLQMGVAKLSKDILLLQDDEKLKKTAAVISLHISKFTRVCLQ